MKHPMIGKNVIVRANVAGVHCGTVEHMVPNKEGVTTEVILKDARRLWRFYARDRSGSISDVAANGLKPGADHHIGATLVRTCIVNPQGFELSECTPEAHKSIFEHPVR